MPRILRLLPLLFLLVPQPAWSQTNTNVNWKKTTTDPGTVVSPGNPLPIGGGFIQTARTADISATVTTSNVAFGTTANTARVCNAGTVTGYVALGDSTITVTAANGIPITGGSCATLSAVGYTYIAGITASSSTTLQVSLGSGIASLGGGGGSAAPSGAAGGDLTGTYPNPTLAWISRASGKTLTMSNTLTFAGVDGSTVDFGSGGTVGPFTIGLTTVTSGTDKGLIYDNAGVIGNLATANSGVLVTSGSGVPSISSTLPSGLTIPGFATTASPTFTGTVTMPDSSTFGTNFAVGGNAILTAPASGSLQHGAIDVDTNAAIVAQVIRSQGNLAGGTSNQAGKNWTFIASPGKGNQAGGSFIFQTTPAGSTGTVVGTPTTALTIDSSQNLTGTGSLTLTNNLIVNGGNITFGNVATTKIYAPAAGSFQFGNGVDAASPQAATLRAQSVIAGTAATSGANWTFIGSLPTGTGTSGDIIFQTGVKTGSGTTQGTATTALTIKGETQAVIVAGTISATITNVATTSAVCYNTGTGLFTYDATIGTCTVSDERLKNMGERIPHALDKLLKINGVYGTWKDPTMGAGRQVFIGAQTAEAVFPELVQTDSQGTKSLDYQRLTAPIIEALRELKADNDNIHRQMIEMKRKAR